MKGFNDFNEYKYKIKQFKLKNNFQYFSDIRQKLLEDSQRVIRKYWLNYKKAKNQIVIKKKTQKVTSVKKEEKKSKFTKRTKKYKKADSPKKSPKKKGNNKRDVHENEDTFHEVVEKAKHLNADIMIEKRSPMEKKKSTLIKLQHAKTLSKPGKGKANSALVKSPRKKFE